MSASPHLNRWRGFAVVAVAYFMTIVDLPAIFALVRRNELSDAKRKTTMGEPQPGLVSAN